MDPRPWKPCKPCRAIGAIGNGTCPSCDGRGKVPQSPADVGAAIHRRIEEGQQNLTLAEASALALKWYKTGRHVTCKQT